MVFSSAIFLFAFLPITFLLYVVIPNIRVKNALLVIVSLIFYAFGEPVYVLIMIVSVIINYGFGLLVAKSGTTAKVSLAFAVVMNLGILGVFKYTDFILTMINDVIGTSIPMTFIQLPIGISFFTFQAMSYVIDVYREPSLKQKNIGRLCLYISFFPQLIAGPIVRYNDIAKEINDRHATPQDVAEGIRRFIFGLTKKLLVANTAGMVVDKIFAMEATNYNIIVVWAGALFYCLQIYYDFSGYSDMAIGMGRMFGFHFKENFNYPYSAVGIKDFWHKWHMSLSGWFREYLYFPLGGNRKGKTRTAINKYIVFFMTGLWHGANLTFVLWGLIHGTFLVLEDNILKPLTQKKLRLIGRIYTIIVVAATFVLFRAETVTQGFSMIGDMFTGFDFSGIGNELLMSVMSPWTIFIFIVGIVFALPVKRVIENYFMSRKKYAETADVISYVIAALLFVICVLSLSSATYNPFIYFRF